MGSMGISPRGRLAVPLMALLGALGCGSSMTTAAKYTGRHVRSDAALTRAARDLDCPLETLVISAETNRRYLNEAALRFVIDGCARRASYVEECDLVDDPRAAAASGWTIVEDSLACRYFLVATLELSHDAGAR